MLKYLLIPILFLMHTSAQSQLADGSIAPDFTLTDYYGTEHTLYDYLDAGIPVILEIFAAHCPSCWAYHQTNTLKTLYNDYGPEGTNELMVIALEHDEGNGHNAFTGIGDPWTTQGNWLEGTPYPIFNVENPDRGVFDDYNVTGYPVVYKICPDRIVERISTSESAAAVHEQAQDCESTLSVKNQADFGNIYYDARSNSVKIDAYQKVTSVHLRSITGQLVQSIQTVASPNVQLKPLKTGIYFLEIQGQQGAFVQKFFVN